MVKKTTKKTTKQAVRRFAGPWFGGQREASSLNDAKNAILLVSILINLGVFIGWLALRVTNIYDDQVANFLFSR